MSRRLQFNLKWLMTAILVIAAYLGGAVVGRQCYEMENGQLLREIRRETGRLRCLQEELRRRYGEDYETSPC
jgi:hypothetical protein